MATASNADIKKMTFEVALQELETIVNGFENGNVELENAVNSYARGAELKEHCQKKLEEAKLKIEKINSSGDQVTTETFEPNNN